MKTNKNIYTPRRHVDMHKSGSPNTHTLAHKKEFEK